MTQHINTLLIDDLRGFKDDRDATVVRTAKDALELLVHQPTVTDLWLDHDLGKGEDGRVADIMPVVDWLCQFAFEQDDLYPVDVIHVHTSNPSGGNQMVTSLRRYGYQVVRESAPNYLHQVVEVEDDDL